MPRAVYGEFLQDVFHSTRTLAAVKGIDVELVAATVTDISENVTGKASIHWENGETTADAVLLTTGKCPEMVPISGSTSNTPDAHLFRDHVSNKALDSIPLNAQIHIVGASLSAFDVINRAFSTQTGCEFVRRSGGELQFIPGPNNRRVILMSRSGRIKAVAPIDPEPIVRENFTYLKLVAEAGERGITLHQIAKAIEADAALNGYLLNYEDIAMPYAGCKTHSDVQTRAADLLEDSIAKANAGKTFVFNLITDALGEIWDAFLQNRLTAEAERDYRRLYESAVLAMSAPCPIATAEKILTLIRAGRVEVVKGARAAEYDPASKRFRVSHDFGTLKAKYLVNAAGVRNRTVTSGDQPALIQAMVKRGLMESYKRDDIDLPGALVDPTSFRLPASQNIYLANMFLWGPTFFTSSARTMATIVEKVLSQMYRTGRFPQLDTG